MTSVKKLSVSADQSGQRLDNFLKKTLKSIPKSLLYKIIRDGQVRVNKCRIKPSYRIQCDDIIRIPPLSSRKDSITPSATANLLVEKNIIFEDEDLMVLNKPSGIAVHSGTKIKADVIGVLRTKEEYRNINLVHRIDKYASGCLVLAKNYKTASSLGLLFSAKKVEKKYIALLYGAIKKKNFSVSKPIQKKKIDSSEKMAISQEGKEAVTEYFIKKNFKKTTLVEANIKTGRTHQIRVHSAEIGHPICGDVKYGNKAINKELRKMGLQRIFLHANKLSFFHKKKYTFTAEIPYDLNNILDTIKEK